MSNTIITIGRTFGSGGREVGRKLAEELGIPFYDKELLEQVARESGVCQEMVSDMDEKPTNSFLYSLVMNTRQSNVLSPHPLYAEDRIESAQKNVLEYVAGQGPCVIIGRRADLVLREKHTIFSIFISAPESFRIDHVAEREGLSPEESLKKIRRMDRQRESYYNYYGDGVFGKASNYNLCLDRKILGVDGCVKLILEALNCVE